MHHHAYGVDCRLVGLSAPRHGRAAGPQQQSSLDITGARPVLLQGTLTASILLRLC